MVSSLLTRSHVLGARGAVAIGTLAVLASGFLLATHLEAAIAFSSAATHSLAIMIPGGC